MHFAFKGLMALLVLANKKKLNICNMIPLYYYGSCSTVDSVKKAITSVLEN